MPTSLLKTTIQQLTAPGKGILAADESTGTIAKRFSTIQAECSAETRRDYREMLFTTPDIEQFVSGVILYEETLSQKTQKGILFPDLLNDRGIVPGIKVDKGTVVLPQTQDEKITLGLDGLADRLVTYKNQGARFAKWRAVLNIGPTLPSPLAIQSNADALAHYAAVCQQQGIIPIVEPELLMDGDHSLERCAITTEQVLAEVFYALHRYHVALEFMILKPSMVIAGNKQRIQSSIFEVAEETVRVLRRTVPSAVPSINFLSGGQSSELATQHLNAMNHLGPQPWMLSFSYGRALQDPALKTWQGTPENVKAAQLALLKRAKLNALAVQGKYTQTMETS
jgi:fructose-bisphosphate aldolase class I